jgi:hypothetical protein
LGVFGASLKLLATNDCCRTIRRGSPRYAVERLILPAPANGRAVTLARSVPWSSASWTSLDLQLWITRNFWVRACGSALSLWRASDVLMSTRFEGSTTGQLSTFAHKTPQEPGVVIASEFSATVVHSEWCLARESFDIK